MTNIARPDSEAAWVAWCHAGGFTQARTTVPDEHVDGMIRVSRVGGERQSKIHESVAMLFEVWHTSAFEAAKLALRLNAHVENVANGTHLNATTRVYGVEATGPAEFPDDSSALVRYQFTATCLARRVSAQRTTGAQPEGSTP